MNFRLPFEQKKHTIVRKREATTDPKLGCEPEKRDIKKLISYGLIVLNKPPGPTSHQVADYVKKIFNVSRCGHGGTLDPNVTGVLPLALDKATRVVQVLLPAGKEYVCLMHLHNVVSLEQIEKAFIHFSGEITQLPPIRSAVKRQLRKRNVYYIELLESEGKDVLFRIGCQAGTYIRKFVHDLGVYLECGAHMVQLVRTKAGPFTDKQMWTLHDIKDAFEFYKEGNEESLRKIILPFERAADHLGKIWVSDGAVDALCHGSDLYAVGVVKYTEPLEQDELVALFTLKNELICIGNMAMDSATLKGAENGVAVKTTKVFMERGIYKNK